MGRVVRCLACGAFVEQGDRFCWSCGQELAGGPAPSALPPPPEMDEGVALLLRRAYLAQRRRRPEEALDLVEQALKQDPECVPALAMLAELLRARGDEVGAVEAAQRAGEVAARRGAPPGALRRAREERAEVEREVLEEVVAHRATPGEVVLRLLSPSGPGGKGRAVAVVALSAVGILGSVWAAFSVARGGVGAWLWFACSVLAAGWCYRHAESRLEPGWLWAALVACLGPFGLMIYLLFRK